MDELIAALEKIANEPGSATTEDRIKAMRAILTRFESQSYLDVGVVVRPHKIRVLREMLAERLKAVRSKYAGAAHSHASIAFERLSDEIDDKLRQPKW